MRNTGVSGNYSYLDFTMVYSEDLDARGQDTQDLTWTLCT